MSFRKKLFKLCDELFEKKDENTKELFQKKTAFLFSKVDLSNPVWYLYQIKISSSKINENHLGFLVPLELMELPVLNDRSIRIEIRFGKRVNCAEHRELFERFSKHIFEHAFDYTNLEFNLQSSTFKLLPCLLTDFDEIDFDRMSEICRRYQQPVEHPALLSDTELYTVWNLSAKPLFISLSNGVPSKRASDRKTNSESYADFYTKLVPNVHIRGELMMGSMRMVVRGKVGWNLEEDSIKLSDQRTVYYPIELLHYAPLNRNDFQLFWKLPPILVRIVQIYHLEKLRRSFADKLHIYSWIKSNEIFFKDSLNEYMQIVALNHLNYDLRVSSNEQPLSDILLQAITRRAANESFDMENLEILGDCFLKFAVSMSLYYLHPSATVGQLTSEKIQEISNENLYRLAVENQLKNHLYSEKIVFQGHDSNWLPPGFVSSSNHSERYLQQKVKRKAFADMIEALIGAYLMSSTYHTTIRFMHCLGLNVIPLRDGSRDLMPIPMIVSEQLNDEIRRIYHQEDFQEIEMRLKYTFRNKGYLIAAYTHPSKVQNGSIYSYERLEFLGDALLDFLVVRQVFLDDQGELNPGRVTNIRQDSTNNNHLGYILVSSNLHQKIRYQSNDLSRQLRTYLDNQQRVSSRDANSIAAPKILADVFEALLAAIFFDSGNSLEIVWKIIEPFLGEFLNRSIINPQLNLLRSFSDQGGKIIIEYLDQTGAVCCVQMPNGCVYEGHGMNKKLAKYDACRQALNSRN